MKFKWLHAEISTRCNAWCPACPRNNNGFGLSKDLIVHDLSVNDLDHAVKEYGITHIQMCGNKGDPLAAKNINEHIDYCGNMGKVHIHTNGSLRKQDWWKTLPERLPAHEVWFALDGIGEVHEYHRQGTFYDKIIDNATSFINSGGNAVWQFIPFKHNEHQIKECIRLSQKLGFSRFEFVKNARYKQKSYHYRTGKEIVIEGWEQDNKFNQIGKDKKIPNEQNCMHKSMPSLFINASGKVSPCCYLKNLDYNDFEGLVYPECIKNCGE